MTGGRKEDSDGLNSPRAGAGRTQGSKNHHPTVKPTELMKYLVRLVTPKNGTVLDPFMGSGSTGKACKIEDFDLNRDPIMPEFELPEGCDNEDDYLRHLTYEGANKRYKEILLESLSTNLRIPIAAFNK